MAHRHQHPHRDRPSLAYYLLGRDSEAWNNAEVALVIGPATAENWVVRSLAAWHMGRGDEAVSDLEAAVALLAANGNSGEARSIQLFCWAAAVDPDGNGFLSALSAKGALEGRC